MSCGLSESALDVLFTLYSNRCLSSSRGYHSKKLESILMKKNPSVKFDKIIQKLRNGGYITPLNKSEFKYYISSFKDTIHALSLHDYPVTQGKK
jgi:hypothetical protein